ncbi:MAG: glucuronate isomerase, partial [Rhodothermales bacterium]
MKPFLDNDFLLETETARRLYHEHAARMPIIDYHCHLPPDQIASDHPFETLTHIWLDGDHYKWRAMRVNGVPERYCTGEASPWEKFEKWAETVPYTMMNPLYHWTHMELKRPFGINNILKPETARAIYDACNEMLHTPAFSTRGLLRQMNVEVVCTTDDPADSLAHHQKIKDDGFEVLVLPAFRADNASAIEEPERYNAYLDRLGTAADVDINSPETLLESLQRRHDFFAERGCRLSDHGEERLYADDYTATQIRATFDKVRGGAVPMPEEIGRFKAWMLYELALMDHAKGWTQQFHLGALRNVNTRMARTIGRDSGFDSIGDFEMARPVARFFDRLDQRDQLAKTIIYNLNPRDNALFAAMIGNFNTGPTPGKMQFGSGWWFLDQKDGMEKQLTTLANMGLLSRFVGMLTDSRSFLSYPRHEYFRR